MLRSWLIEFSRYLPGGSRPVLRNACIIIAMRRLLGDSTWGPKLVVSLIQQHDGFPVEYNIVIPRLAQVVLINEQASAVGDGQHVNFIVPGKLRIYTVAWHAPIVVVYETRRGRGHADCIPAHRLLRRRTVACAFLRLDTLEEPYRDDTDDTDPYRDGFSGCAKG